MSNFTKINLLNYLILFLICLIHYCTCLPSEYEKIISTVKPVDKVSNKSKEKTFSQPIIPMVYGKFWCDPSFKLNSVREDIMTNLNFNT